MAKKKIAVVTYNVNDGLVYQRIHLPFRHLKNDYEFIFRDINDVHHSDMFYVDALLLVHPWSPDMLYLASRARRHYGIPVIIDLDDLLQAIPTDHPEYIYFRGAKVDQILMQADMAVYSTENLHRRLAHLTKHSCVIENTINEKMYQNLRPINNIHKNCFIVGWTGAQNHRGDQYYSFLDGLVKFMETYEDTKAYFHLLCPEYLRDRFGSRIIYEPVPADFLDYPAFSQTYPFDVCMVGLMKHEFNEAKSDLKLLEMAPNKIPIIASPCSDFIRHKDKNVMLYADDEKEGFKSWFEQLEWAYKNQEELKGYGERAYNYVMAERLSTNAAFMWKQVLDQIVV